MKISTIVLCLTVSVLLGGCTRYAWVKPMGDPATYPSDNYACQESAMANAPPVFQTYAPPPHYYAPMDVHTYCRDRGHHTVCRTHGHGYPYVSPPQTVDLNAHNRSNLFNACMQARGWILQAVEDPE